MTSSRAACVGPFAVSARPTASTAAIWLARRRWPADAARAWAMARSREATVRRAPMASTIIVTARATPRWRTPGSDRRRRDADEQERRHGRRPEDDGLAGAEHGRQRDDQEVQAGQRHGREIVAPKAHPEDDRQGHQQSRRVERRRTSGGSAQGEGHLDRRGRSRRGTSRPTASSPAISSITRAAKTTATARMTCGSAAMRFIARRRDWWSRNAISPTLQCRDGGVDHTIGGIRPTHLAGRTAQRGAAQRQRIVPAASSAVARISSSSRALVRLDGEEDRGPTQVHDDDPRGPIGLEVVRRPDRREELDPRRVDRGQVARQAATAIDADVGRAGGARRRRWR